MPDDEASVENPAFSTPRLQMQDDDDDDDEMEAGADGDKYVDEIVVSATVTMVFRKPNQ
jgi:hypothetical protein